MSLIRSTSNYEKIYAYHNVNGNTCIHRGPNRTICMPIETFGTVVGLWLDKFEDETVEHNGFKISQRFIYGLITIILSHSGTHIAMSYATFAYMTDEYRWKDYNEIMNYKKEK